MSPARVICGFAFVLGLAGLVACSSGSSGGGGGGNGSSGAPGADGAAARQFFIDKVYPAIEPTCAKCHATGEHGATIFLAGDGPSSYTALEGVTGLIAPANSSPLVQHGLHAGPALTSNQGDLMTQWLNMEATARKLNGSNRPANLRAAFKAFGACMDYTEWLQLGLDKIPDTDTENSGQCRSCHIEGQASLFLSDDTIDTFNHFTQFPFVQRLVVGSVNTSGAFDSLQNSRRMIDKGTEAQQANANSHPRFGLSPAVQANITQFVNDTLSNMNAARCDSAVHPDAGADAAQ
jgi:hypothetical protein